MFSQSFLKSFTTFLLLLCFSFLQQKRSCSAAISVSAQREDHTATSTTTSTEAKENMSPSSVLVIGATGATGRHVVKQLLDQGGVEVKVVVRSKERMHDALRNITASDSKGFDEKLLVVKEASLLDLSDEEILQQVANVDAVVSCLGHNLDLKGIFGHPRRLVTDAARRLTTAMAKSDAPGKKKFVMMGSDGVSNPAGTDDKRSFVERTVLWLLRHLIPPHADNEEAAAYLYHELKPNSDGASKVEWVVVRPTDLVDKDEVSKYVLHDKPQGSLFGSGTASRINVAKTMVDMLSPDEKLWNKYRFTMPVMYDADDEGTGGGGGEKKKEEL